MNNESLEQIASTQLKLVNIIESMSKQMEQMIKGEILMQTQIDLMQKQIKLLTEQLNGEQ